MMPSFQRVANKRDLKEGGLMKVDVGGTPIVLAMVSSKVYAMDAVCSHEGGPLEDGTLDGYELKCPWHYAIFDVRNARVSEQTTWASDLKSYPVQVDEGTGDISVKLEPVRQEDTTQKQSGEQEKTAKALENDKKFYEEEERKAHGKLPLKLISKEKLEGTDIMTFKLERDDMDFSAGQFGYFKLEGVKNDPRGPIRHFSFASSPTEEEYLMISTRIRDTPYKKKLASLEIGSPIQTWGPQGEFVLHDDNSKPAVFLSGGIGVTPFRSMIKYATDKHLPMKIVMFDSNRDERNILYRHEFDRWASQNRNLNVIYTVTDQNPSVWTGEKGRINKEMINRHANEETLAKSIFYVCGPPAMLDAMHRLLQKDLQIPKERIKIEEFTGY
ncbi:MAG TPA: Rieske 2Fe-2S domain-containing protein [Nitrososphaera sp.]|nr:Rieske 2Fe-2S domain-containing protein [Nitrososphaera sp.]